MPRKSLASGAGWRRSRESCFIRRAPARIARDNDSVRPPITIGSPITCFALIWFLLFVPRARPHQCIDNDDPVGHDKQRVFAAVVIEELCPFTQ